MLLYPTSAFARDPFFRDPFAALRRLHDEIDRGFAPLTTGSAPGHAPAGFPAVNMWQGEHSIALTAELPGFKAEDIDISVKDDTLTISGQRSSPEVGEKAVWHLRERPFGRFARSIGLPFRVDAEKVNARFVNGVLEIELSRPEEDRPRRIEVKSA
ncbi:MAG TPA: Hsp20/alpha crystallin family protein [Thermohalobaculum sp.]|nr:Hsp20/alpha crystallin family protein [Thermohalobaculum sp.]